MFEAFEAMKEETNEKRYKERLLENNAEKHLVSGASEGSLAKAIRIALSDEEVVVRDKGLWRGRFEALSDRCRATKNAPWFSHLITVTILCVGVQIGVDTDSFMRCDRKRARRASRPAGGARVHCEESALSAALGIASQVG
jgi:hypothetical protein